MVRVKWGAIPADRTDGYLVYYGTLDEYTDDEIDLTSLTKMPTYKAWSEVVFYDALGDVVSNEWETTGIYKEANFMSISWMFMGLIFLALGLMAACYAWKKPVLAFAAAGGWLFLGIYSYTLIATEGQFYWALFFFCMGMTMVSVFEAIGQRGKKEIGDDYEDDDENKPTEDEIEAKKDIIRMKKDMSRSTSPISEMRAAIRGKRKARRKTDVRRLK